jgi:glycosyltransferase involved in cell wall biosynthesis
METTRANPLPLVSVITPVYNGGRYLAECIESVLAQTYENWEYLIVNNCSTDSTLEIARSYAQRDARILVRDNETFLGKLENHNVALRQISSQSKYCKVVHADDWLFPECIMRMVELAEANPSVGIVGAYRLDDVWVNCDGLPYPSTVVPGREICRSSLLGGPNVFGTPTSILVRSDIVRKRSVFYSESYAWASIWADSEACYEVLQTSDFGFVHQVLTYTRRHHEAGSTYAREVRSSHLGALLNLKKYGPIYLDRSEYDECLRRRKEGYYRFLSRTILLRDKRAWTYHRDALKDLRCRLSAASLLKALFLETMDALLYPFNTARKAFSRTRKEWKPPVKRRRTPLP